MPPRGGTPLRRWQNCCSTYLLITWSRLRDLNPGPTVYAAPRRHPAAAVAKLLLYLLAHYLEPPQGFEPWTYSLCRPEAAPRCGGGKTVALLTCSLPGAASG